MTALKLILVGESNSEKLLFLSLVFILFLSSPINEQMVSLSIAYTLLKEH